MPRPAAADIRCSTVDTCTSPFDSVVDSRVADTFAGCATMRTGGSKSVRRSTTPVSGGAGSSRIEIFSPVCRPMPSAQTLSRRVCC